MEKIIFKRREGEINKCLTKFQCGGVVERGIQDNLFVKNHIINEYRKKRKNLYILFADIEKCYDNLWLKDCIVELSRSEVPIQELIYIYKMNQVVKATVVTPVGKTEEISK